MCAIKTQNATYSSSCYPLHFLPSISFLPRHSSFLINQIDQKEIHTRNMRRKHRLTLPQLRTQLLQLQRMQRPRRLLVIRMSLRPPFPPREHAHLCLALSGELGFGRGQPALEILFFRLGCLGVLAVLFQPAVEGRFCIFGWDVCV